MIALLSMGGATQEFGPFEDGRFPQTVKFEVTDSTRPVGVNLRTRVSNNWHYYEISVVDPAGETLFEAGREVSYYSGGSGEDAWSEGSRKASLVFQPTQVGTYALKIDRPEIGARGQDRLWGDVQDGRPAIRWLVGAMLLVGLIAAIPFARRAAHHSRRWSGSDWTEDSD